MKKTYLILFVILFSGQIFSQNYVGNKWNGVYKGTGYLESYKYDKNFDVPVIIEISSKDNILVMKIDNPDYKDAVNISDWMGKEDYFAFLFLNNVNNLSRAEHIADAVKIIVNRNGNTLSGTARKFDIFNGNPTQKLTFKVYKQ